MSKLTWWPSALSTVLYVSAVVGGPAAQARPDAERLAPTTASAGWLRRLAGASVWNLTDQALSALTNAAVFFVVVRATGTSGGDAFAVAVYLFSTVIGFERTLVGQVLSIRYSATTGPHWQQALSRSFGLVTTLSVGGGLLIGLVSMFWWGSTLGSVLLVTAGCLPGLILQDTCRMAFFAHSRGRAATANDALWAVLQFSAMGILINAGDVTAPALVSCWGLSACVCALVGMWQLGAAPQPRYAASWLGDTWKLSRFLLAEYILTTGSFNGGFMVVGAIVGAGALTALRGAQVLLGPLGILTQAMLTFALPQLSRHPNLRAQQRMRIAVGLSGGMAIIALCYLLVLVSMPHAWGELLLGKDWDLARSVIVPVAIGMVGAGACVGPAVNLYALGRTRATLGLIVVEAPMVLVLMIGGATVNGALGAAWGMAFAQVFMVPWWFLVTRRELHRLGNDVVDADSTHTDDTHPDGKHRGAVHVPAAPEPWGSDVWTRSVEAANSGTSDPYVKGPGRQVVAGPSASVEGASARDSDPLTDNVTRRTSGQGGEHQLTWWADLAPGTPEVDVRGIGDDRVRSDP